MTDRIWLQSYPAGVPADLPPSPYVSLVALMEESFRQYAQRPAYSFMGKDFSYAEVDRLSQAFAVYLQGLGMRQGDRVALMMPNIPQYPVVVAATMAHGPTNQRDFGARRLTPGHRHPSAAHGLLRGAQNGA